MASIQNLYSIPILYASRNGAIYIDRSKKHSDFSVETGVGLDRGSKIGGTYYLIKSSTPIPISYSLSLNKVEKAVSRTFLAVFSSLNGTHMKVFTDEESFRAEVDSKLAIKNLKVVSSNSYDLDPP